MKAAKRRVMTQPFAAQITSCSALFPALHLIMLAVTTTSWTTPIHIISGFSQRQDMLQRNQANSREICMTDRLPLGPLRSTMSPSTSHSPTNEEQPFPQPHSSSSTSEDILSSSFFRESIQVFDGVFSERQCWDLHDLAIEHAERTADTCDGSSIFDRKNTPRSKWTPLEQALDRCLTAMDDHSNVVEYWSRHEWMNIDTHSDIDEEEFFETGHIRTPNWAHVLYLMIDVDFEIEGEKSCAPTVVWNKWGGWDVTKGESVDDENTADVEMVTVPAKMGRILRFPGSAMHAVPRPVDRWMLADHELRDLEQWERDEEVEDRKEWREDKENDPDMVWDASIPEEELSKPDDDWEETYDLERSVILFNTWTDHGPRDIDPDPVGWTVPEGIEVTKEVESYIEETRQEQMRTWTEAYGGNNFDHLHCRPRSEWHQQPIAVAEEDGTPMDFGEEQICANGEASNLRLSLMGDRDRRRHPKKIAHVPMTTYSRETLHNAFTRETIPTHLIGRQ